MKLTGRIKNVLLSGLFLGAMAYNLVWTDAAVSNEKLTAVTGEPTITVEQAEAYLHKINPKAPYLAKIYEAEGKLEGIRWDVAFAQSIKETGFWRFGGDVLAKQNNFARLGASNTRSGGKGAWFKTPTEGIRAQIQHLKAYAGTEALKGKLVDPRFKYVTRGYAPYVQWLGAADNPKNAERKKKGEPALGWAIPGKGYGNNILVIIDKISTEKTDR